MKSLLKTFLLVVLSFSGSIIQAQDERDSSARSYSILANYNSDLFQNYNQLQAFGYYNNPEITKLESEVEKLASLYRKGQYENEKGGFSSDKYQNLNADEKKFLKNLSNRYFFGGTSMAVAGNRSVNIQSKKDDSIDKTAEEYFNNVVVNYLSGDKSLNKQKISDDIKKKLDQLFEMKESEKQKEVAKLEQQLRTLQSTLTERKKNKQQIIDQRMNELVGLPNTLRW